MALEGTLRDFSLADIFQLISIQKKTGLLTLKDGEDVVTVTFVEGSVVAADSARKNIEDRLGQVLVKSGRITEDQLSRALQTQKQTLQRLGHVLVQGGFITGEELGEALRIQVAQMVYRLFAWKDGDYHFSQEESVEYDRHHLVPMSAESVLLEGVRMIDEWPMIEQRITSFDLVFRKTRPDLEPVIVEDSDQEESDLESELDRALTGRPKDPAGDGAIRLTRTEEQVYRQIDGKTTVQEIVDRGFMSDFETCRTLYDLACRNLISTSEEQFAKKDPVVPRTGRLAPWIETGAWIGLILWVATSALSLSRSPLSGSPRHLAPEGAIEEMLDLVSRNRVQRLDEAVRVYYLQKGFYPDDLGDLLRGNLVSEATLMDPWGRRFGYLSSDQGYRIIAYNEGGVEDLERSLERGHLVTAGDPKAQGAERKPSARR